MVRPREAAGAVWFLTLTCWAAVHQQGYNPTSYQGVSYRKRLVPDTQQWSVGTGQGDLSIPQNAKSEFLEVTLKVSDSKIRRFKSPGKGWFVTDDQHDLWNRKGGESLTSRLKSVSEVPVGSFKSVWYEEEENIDRFKEKNGDLVTSNVISDSASEINRISTRDKTDEKNDINEVITSIFVEENINDEIERKIIVINEVNSIDSRKQLSKIENIIENNVRNKSEIRNATEAGSPKYKKKEILIANQEEFLVRHKFMLRTDESKLMLNDFIANPMVSDQRYHTTPHSREKNDRNLHNNEIHPQVHSPKDYHNNRIYSSLEKWSRLHPTTIRNSESRDKESQVPWLEFFKERVREQNLPQPVFFSKNSPERKEFTSKRFRREYIGHSNIETTPKPSTSISSSIGNGPSSAETRIVEPTTPKPEVLAKTSKLVPNLTQDIGFMNPNYGIAKEKQNERRNRDLQRQAMINRNEGANVTPINSTVIKRTESPPLPQSTENILTLSEMIDKTQRPLCQNSSIAIVDHNPVTANPYMTTLSHVTSFRGGRESLAVINDTDEVNKSTFTSSIIDITESSAADISTEDASNAVRNTTGGNAGNTTETKRPFDLYDRKLPCAAADKLSAPARTSHCEFEWNSGGELPLVRCELVAKIGDLGGFLYNSGWFSSSCGERTPSGRLCLRPVAYTVRRREKLGALGSSVLTDDPLLKVLRSEQGQRTLTVVLSHGFREAALRLRPDAIGPRGLLNADPCRNCTPDVWIFQYKYDMAVMRLYMNRSYGLRLLFEPAFVRLTSVWLSMLTEEALLEELEVHGGERWDEVGDEAVLPRLPRLRTLDLAGNGLTRLHAENFKRNLKIQELNLGNNKFTTLPEGVSLLLDLRILNLSDNPLSVPSYVGALRPLAQLRTLDLSHVPLGGLEPLDIGAVSGYNESNANGSSQLLPRLEVLDVRNCSIGDLRSAAGRRVLNDRPTLRVLFLSKNELRQPPPSDLVTHLPALRELRMRACGLHKPPALRLARNSPLHLLDLANNHLETAEGVIANDSAGAGVRELDLSGNPLRRGWGAGAFAALGSNASVNLSRTGIASLSSTMLNALQPLQQVDLGGNQLDCGLCEAAGLRAWLKQSGGPQVLVLGTATPLRCTHPESVAGRPLVDVSETDSTCQQGSSGGDGGGEEGERVGDEGAGAGARVAAAAAAACGGALLALGLLVLKFRLELTYALHVLRANRWMRAATTAEQSSAPHEFDAFVCYSKFDRAWVVGELLPRLEGSSPRYRLCLHERDFPLGSLIVQNIVECMARSRRTLIVLTRAFIDSQWCQWELEMATHRLLEGAQDFLVLVELERLDTRQFPRLLRLLVETRTFLQWPTAAEATGSVGDRAEDRDADAVMDAAWRRLRDALGPPLPSSRRSSRRHAATVLPNTALPATATVPALKSVSAGDHESNPMAVFSTPKIEHV